MSCRGGRRRFRPSDGIIARTLHPIAIAIQEFLCDLVVATSHIRGAMVRMMTLSTAQQLGDSPYDCLEQGRLDTILTEDGITTGNQLSMGPSACTFWCAVGLGALVKGSPVHSVSKSGAFVAYLVRGEAPLLPVVLPALILA